MLEEQIILFSKVQVCPAKAEFINDATVVQ
jgi:hypothetical protein